MSLSIITMETNRHCLIIYNPKSKALHFGNTSKALFLSNLYTSLPINPTTPGEVIITKNVINQGGGTNKPSDFTISVSGNNPSPASFSGSTDGITVQLRAGKFSVIEEGPISSDYVPGKYTPNYSADCNGTIKSGETKNCIITNKYNPFIPEKVCQLYNEIKE